MYHFAAPLSHGCEVCLSTVLSRCIIVNIKSNGSMSLCDCLQGYCSNRRQVIRCTVQFVQCCIHSLHALFLTRLWLLLSHMTDCIIYYEVWCFVRPLLHYVCSVRRQWIIMLMLWHLINQLVTRNVLSPLTCYVAVQFMIILCELKIVSYNRHSSVSKWDS